MDETLRACRTIWRSVTTKKAFVPTEGPNMTDPAGRAATFFAVAGATTETATGGCNGTNP